MNERTLRVGYIVKRYPRYSETFIVNEILAHERAGWEVEIFALRPPLDTHYQDRISRVRSPVTYLKQEKVKGDELWRIIRDAALHLPGLWSRLSDVDTTNAHEVYQAIELALLVEERGIQHLHAHFATSATSVAEMAAMFADVPFTFTAHAKDIFHQEVCEQELERKLSRAAAVVTVSDFNEQYLKEKFGPAAINVLRIYNGLDLEDFPFSPSASTRNQIVAVGRLVEKKGFADLVQACGILRDRGIDFSCTIVGVGDQQTDLEQRVADRQLDSHVEFTGALPQREVIRLVREAAVFAAPCIVGADGNRDGLPTVLLEAMALGTPCVATDVTGIPEVIRDGQTGLIVRQHDPAHLADAIGRLLSTSALQDKLRSQARVLIAQQFDIDKNAQHIRQLIESISSQSASLQGVS